MAQPFRAKEIVDVHLPGPRLEQEVFANREFFKMREEVWTFLKEEQLPE